MNTIEDRLNAEGHGDYVRILDRIIKVLEVAGVLESAIAGLTQPEVDVFKGGLLLGFHLGANRSKHGL